MSPHSPSKRWRKWLYVHSWWWALGSGPGKLPSDTTLRNDNYFQSVLTNEEDTPKFFRLSSVMGQCRASSRLQTLQTPCLLPGKETCGRDWGEKPYWRFPREPVAACFCLCSTLRCVSQPGTQWLPVLHWTQCFVLVSGFVPLSQLGNIKAYFLKISTF